MWDPSLTKHAKIALVHHTLMQYRLSIANEKETQRDIEFLLTQAKIPFEREKTLGEAGIIDFLVDDTIGLEVKIKGTKMAIYRQCKRYCLSPQIDHLILATLGANTLPVNVEGKSTSVLSLSRAFLY